MAWFTFDLKGVYFVKLTQFQNPVTGQRGNILNLGNLWSLALGGVVLFMVWGLASNLFGVFRGFMPQPLRGMTAPVPIGPAGQAEQWRPRVFGS